MGRINNWHDVAHDNIRVSNRCEYQFLCISIISKNNEIEIVNPRQYNEVLFLFKFWTLKEIILFML